MGRYYSTKKQRRCIQCDTVFKSQERHYSIECRDRPDLFRDGEYIGNRDVKKRSHNVVVLHKTYHVFKYGNFCKLTCAADWANRQTGAIYRVDHQGVAVNYETLKSGGDE